MARIPRKTQKVFCGNSNAGEIAVFGTMKTGTPQYSTDIETLQSNEYEQGWSDAILNDKAPYLEEMNGVQYAFSRQIAYLLQQGLANEWDTNTIYFKGSTVAVINDITVTYYRSVSNDNQSNNPTTDDGTNWVLDSISKIESYNTTLTNAINTLNSQVVKLTGNQTVAGNKTFTGVTKVPNSATVGTAVNTAGISKTATTNTAAYVKFGNGLIIQWLKFTQSSDAVKHSWKIPFTSGTSYVTVLSQINNGQDENIAVTAQTASNFTCDAESAERSKGLYAIGIGY